MYQEKIKAFFAEHTDEMIADISTLIRIPSVGADPAPNAPYGMENVKVLNAAMELASGYGFETTNYDNYVMAADYNNKEKGLDILAHLDVVPASPKDWTVTLPFEPVVQNGKLYGRGSADDKGPAVAALYAMRAVKELQIPLKTNVRLILGTDEERGSSDLAYYFSKEKEAPQSFTPDADFPVINVEKGRLATSIQASYEKSTTLPRLISFSSGHTVNVIPDEAKAVIQGLNEEQLIPHLQSVTEHTKVAFSFEKDDTALTISAKGIGGHAAQPQHGNNALTAMLALLTRLPLGESDGFAKLSALGQLFPHGDWTGTQAGVASHDDISGDTTISLNIITLNETSFDAKFDARCSLSATEENLNQVFIKKTEQSGLLFVDKPLTPPHHVSGDSDFVKTLLKCYEQYTGKQGECLAIGGGTYVHNLEYGVAFGAVMPGTENNMHGADEFAVIDDLLLAGTIFAQAIIDLCGE